MNTQASTSPLAADHKRVDLALEATFQIESLTRATEDLLNNYDENKWHALMSIAARTRQLSCVILSALSDDIDPVSSISLRLAGEV